MILFKPFKIDLTSRDNFVGLKINIDIKLLPINNKTLSYSHCNLCISYCAILRKNSPKQVLSSDYYDILIYNHQHDLEVISCHGSILVGMVFYF